VSGHEYEAWRDQNRTLQSVAMEGRGFTIAGSGHPGLGAQTGDVIRMILQQSVRLSVVAILLGVSVALVASHWIKPLLLQTSSRDPFVYGLVAATLLHVAFGARWPQRGAWRAWMPALRCVRSNQYAATHLAVSFARQCSPALPIDRSACRFPCQAGQFGTLPATTPRRRA